MASRRPQSQARAGERITLSDARRQPFLWCSLEVIAHLRATIPDAHELVYARSLYLALAELAARAYDGMHDGFSTSRAELAACAVISERRLSPHLERLVSVGLLEITEQTDARGKTLPNVYRLVDPPASMPEPTPDAASPPDARAPERHPPTRTRPNRWKKKKKERERESARRRPRAR